MSFGPSPSVAYREPRLRTLYATDGDGQSNKKPQLQQHGTDGFAAVMFRMRSPAAREQKRIAARNTTHALSRGPFHHPRAALTTTAPPSSGFSTLSDCYYH